MRISGIFIIQLLFSGTLPGVQWLGVLPMGETADCPYVRIACKISDFLPLEAIEEFQGNFKKRTKKEIGQIITSILKFGFSFPFFV
jgi:hypothetical protein